MRILIVEDDEFSNIALMHLLESEHEVFATREAESADLVLRNQQFDLILLDIGLPGMDGIALSEHVRNQSVNRETPIVAVSGMEGDDVVKKAQISGFNAFIKKPYTVDALREVIGMFGQVPTPPEGSDFRVFQ